MFNNPKELSDADKQLKERFGNFDALSPDRLMNVTQTYALLEIAFQLERLNDSMAKLANPMRTSEILHSPDLKINLPTMPSSPPMFNLNDLLNEDENQDVQESN